MKKETVAITLKISSCNKCLYFKAEYDGYYCEHPKTVGASPFPRLSNFNRNKKIYDTCGLRKKVQR